MASLLLPSAYSLSATWKKIFKAILQEQNRLSSSFNLFQGVKIQLNKSIQRSKCKQDGTGVYSIQSTARRRVSWLYLQLSKIPSFCCLHDTIDVKSETWGPHVDYVTSNVETIAFDVSPAMVSHLTSYYRRYAQDANFDIFQFSLSQK